MAIETIDLRKHLLARANALQQPPFLKAAAELMVSSILRSFQLGGRTSGDIARPFDGGSVKWRPVNTAYGVMKAKMGKSATAILLFTSRLRNSIGWQLVGKHVELGSNASHAAIHQYGGEIRVTPRSRAYFRYRAATSKTKEEVSFWIGMSRKKGDKIRIHARPMITVQAEDYEDLSDIAAQHLGK